MHNVEVFCFSEMPSECSVSCPGSYTWRPHAIYVCRGWKWFAVECWSRMIASIGLRRITRSLRKQHLWKKHCSIYTSLHEAVFTVKCMVWLADRKASVTMLGRLASVSDLPGPRETASTSNTTLKISKWEIPDTNLQGYAAISTFNLLKTKRNLLYIRNQSVPRSKHFPSRL